MDRATVVEVLARAVASPHAEALTIRPDNTSGGWLSIAAAVRAGTAFAVPVRQGVVCFDVDTTELPAGRRRQVRTAINQLCTNREVVVVASGRPGHLHVFWATEALPRAEVAAALEPLSALGIHVRRGLMRSPLSPHRLGLPVGLVHPSDATQASEWLTAPMACDSLGPPSALSSRMLRVLREGHDAGGYLSASHARMALAVAAVSAGYGPRWLEAVLEDPRNELGASFRARSASWRDEEIERLVTKARRWQAENRHRREVSLPGEAFGARHRAEFRGRGGATDLAVLEGLVRMAKRCGRNPLGASTDQIAIEAGVHRVTARRALRRLQGRGWLAVRTEATAIHSTVWEIIAPSNAPSDIDAHSPGERAHTSQPAVLDRSDADDLGIDAARWGALGKSRSRVLRELSSRPASTAELAARLGIATGTARRHLGGLAQDELALRVPDGWVRTGLSTDTVAYRAGTLGSRQRQKDAYARALTTRRRLSRLEAFPVATTALPRGA